MPKYKVLWVKKEIKARDKSALEGWLNDTEAVTSEITHVPIKEFPSLLSVCLNPKVAIGLIFVAVRMMSELLVKEEFNTFVLPMNNAIIVFVLLSLFPNARFFFVEGNIIPRQKGDVPLTIVREISKATLNTIYRIHNATAGLQESKEALLTKQKEND